MSETTSKGGFPRSPLYLEQLVVSLVEIRPLLLVLPAEKTILPGIGEPVLSPLLLADLWPQLFSDVSCIALWISSEKILTRLYSVLHWFHKRLEANVKKPRENRCFQTVIVFSFSSFDNSKKCTVLLKIAARLITVSTSVNKEMWESQSFLTRRSVVNVNPLGSTPRAWDA